MARHRSSAVLAVVLLAAALLACTAVSGSRVSSKLTGGGGLLAPAAETAEITANFYSVPVGDDETTLRSEFATLTAEAAKMAPDSAKLSATRSRLLVVAARIIELTKPMPPALKQVRATAAPAPQAAPAALAAVVTEETHGDQPPLDFDPWADSADQPKSQALSFVSLDEDATSLLESYADAEFAAANSKCTAKQGVCKSTSLGCSGGAFSSGLCSGASNIKCCIKKAAVTVTSSACAARKGTCKSRSAGCSGGSFWTGLCAGSSDIKCCIPKTAAATTPAKTTSSTKTTTSAACAARSGTCKSKSLGCSGGSFWTGLCAGAADIKCCIPKSASSSGSSGSTVATASGPCGALYGDMEPTSIKGNGGVSYPVVPIHTSHLFDPSIASRAPTASDNTMLTTTACAFDAMHRAAKAQGVLIKINSGFRTLARQQYFWNCYRSKKCNNGNLAAAPGTSNHGIGKAVDLNSKSTGVYTWLKNNAHKFGFVRTVPSEKWHWEHRVGWRRAPYT